MNDDTQASILVLGYPKSGTTWLSRLLGDALDSPVGGLDSDGDHLCIATEGQDRPGPYHIRQGHSVPEDAPEGKKVIMLRDPRDVAVSVRSHWKMEGLSKAVECMLDESWGRCSWVSWVRAWQEVPVAAITSYEVLHQWTKDELWRIIDVLGVIPAADWYGAVERQSFEVRRAWTEEHGDDLNYGKASQLRFLRRGIIGDWQNHVWGEAYAVAMREWGLLMEELGYD